MPQSTIVYLIVAACIVYLIGRVWWLKSKKKTGGCSHGSCGCETTKPDLKIEPQEGK